MRVGMNPNNLPISTVSENILTITLHLSLQEEMFKRKLKRTS